MTQFDFSHLQVGGTVTYSVYQLMCPPGTKDKEGKPLKHPRLVLAPATEDTPLYWEQIMSNTARNARRLRGGRIDPSVLEETRQHDLQLFPKHIILGWEGIFDTSGAAVPFSRDACKEFLGALPAWVFNEIRTFASEPTNFLPNGTLSPEEADGLGEG